MNPIEEQLELINYRPNPDPSDVNRWVALVWSKRGWITAAQCIEVLGDQFDGDDRTIRSFAEACGGCIISGRKGYKHIDHATTEEVDHFCNQMESQARRMLDRSCRTRTLAHRIVG